jgi:hypothetical protein
MRLDSALKISRPQYISAQKISTLLDALDEREIGVIVPYEISKVNFRVETKNLVSMSEEI